MWNPSHRNHQLGDCMHNLDKLVCQDCKENLTVFPILTKSPLVIYLALGVTRKQQVDQAIAHWGQHKCEHG